MIPTSGKSSDVCECRCTDFFYIGITFPRYRSLHYLILSGLTAECRQSLSGITHAPVDSSHTSPRDHEKKYRVSSLFALCGRATPEYWDQVLISHYRAHNLFLTNYRRYV